MRTQVDIGREQVGAFAYASQRGHMHAVALGLQQVHHPAPTPSAVPGAMHEDEISHGLPALMHWLA
jgi:hypothetical protein